MRIYVCLTFFSSSSEHVPACAEAAQTGIPPAAATGCVCSGGIRDLAWHINITSSCSRVETEYQDPRNRNRKPNLTQPN